MCVRSFDSKIAEEFGDMVPRNWGFNWTQWLENERNVMLVDGENVGLGTYDYPGVYTVHWLFTARGKYARDLAIKMLDHFFSNYDVKAVRGLTAVNLKGARWLARNIGFKSYGIQEHPEGPLELFCLTKEDFYNGRC